MAKLSKTEIEFYQDNGYVVPDYKIPDQMLERLRQALDETLVNNPEVRPEQLVSIHTSRARPNDTKGHSTFLDVALDAELVELVSSVLGQNIIMWGAQLFCKPATDGMEVPMHQDGQYWPISPLATCSMWLAIDATDRDNGCLEVIPGSHKNAIHYQHKTEERGDLVLNQSVNDPRIFSLDSKFIELEAGQLSLHDVYLVHGSRPNRSGRRRAGFTVRYMPTSSVLKRDIDIPFAGYPVNWRERPLWLVSGRDVSGQNDLATGHS